MALLGTSTVNAAAAAAGIGKRTLARWLRDPAFQAELAATRQRVAQMAESRIVTAQTTAVDVLLEIAQDTAAPHAARVGAARGLLEAAGRLRDIALEGQIAALERSVAQMAQTGPMRPATGYTNGYANGHATEGEHGGMQ